MEIKHCVTIFNVPYMSLREPGMPGAEAVIVTASWRVRLVGTWHLHIIYTHKNVSSVALDRQHKF